MKNTITLVLIALAAFLSVNCQDPMAGRENVIGKGDGLITVTIGGSNARTIVNWANALDSSQLTHTITVFGGPGKAPASQIIPPGGTTVHFSVAPGEWTISVEAHYEGDLIAVGKETKQIKPGNNPTVIIQMMPVDLPDCTVTFHSNGGSDVPPETVKKYNKATSVTPHRADWGFAGWFSDSALTAHYNFNTPVTGNLDLYAKWSDEFWVVTFYDDTTLVDTQNIAYNGLASAPAELTKLGHTGEWYKEPSFNTLWDFDNDIVTNEMSLYLKWTPNTYHVSFNAKGGSGTMPNQPFTYGIEQALTPNAYNRDGHIFDGWATSEYGTKVYDDKESVKNLTSIANDTVVLYAVWTENNLVNASPPDISKQPAAINEIYLGETVELIVTATPPTSGGNLTYQWYSNTSNNTNGTLISGATLAAYKTSDTLGVGTYYYYCVVTNTDTSVNGNHTAPVTSGTAKVIVYGVGSGTEPDPFIVHDEPTLRKVATETEPGGWTRSAYYLQIKDITLPEPAPGQSNWTPIGSNIEFTDWSTGEPVEFTDNSFIGSYDGNGKTIRNLKIYEPSCEEYYGYPPQGLFGCISDSTVAVGNIGIVKNVGIVYCNITCYGGGGVVGDNYGTVQNCYVIGDVSGTSYEVGGVVGRNYGTVQNCYVMGDVSKTGSSSPVGGVVGDNYDYGTVEYCYSTGNVSGINYVGGVVGQNRGTVQNCYSTGNVSGSYCGGVVGITYNGTVKNCYATGNVSFGGGVAHMGSSIVNCVALNPSITGIARVSNISGSSGGGDGNDPIVSGYARKDMLVNGETQLSNYSQIGKGADIISSDWGNASWWTETAEFDDEVWDFSGLDGTNLPKLKGMPGGIEAQNPVIITLP